jgi:serine/threonine protein kinase
MEELAYLKLDVGQRVDRYVIRGRVRGTQVDVTYRASNEATGQDVLRHMFATDVDSARSREALCKSVYEIANVKHPNVLRVLCSGTLGRAVFAVTERFESQTLGEWLSTGHDWAQIVTVMRAAAEGLWAAHCTGIGHFDPTPARILVGRDMRTRIVGFRFVAGLTAPYGDAGSTLRRSFTEAEADEIAALRESIPRWSEGSPMHAAYTGRIGYIAPEHLYDSRLDPGTDQFSCGVTMFEALFGKRPFPGETYEAYRNAVLYEDDRPRVPRDLPVPAWIGRIACRAVERDRQKRFASMLELREALEREPTGWQAWLSKWDS